MKIKYLYSAVIALVGCLFLATSPLAAVTPQDIAPSDKTSVFMNQLEKQLIAALATQGIEGNLRIELIGEQPEILKQLYYGEADLQHVTVANVNANNGYFSAMAELRPLHMQRNVMVQLQGQYEDVVYVPVIKNKIVKGEVITEENVTLLQQSRRQLKSDTVMNTEDLIGKMARRTIQPGKNISARMVSAPILVHKGHHVTITYNTPSVYLRTIGLAMEEGEKGALVQVKNTSSGLVIQAVVKGPNEVMVPSIQDSREQL